MIPADNPIPTLLRLIDCWVADLNDIHRVSLDQIPEFVPPPLRELYAFAGNYPVPYDEQWRHPKWIHGLFGPQDQLLPIDQLRMNDLRFQFIHENQGVWRCETDANREDPPVYSDSTAYERGHSEGTMIEVCPTLSHFLTTFCLQEITFGSKRLLSVDTEIQNPHDAVLSNVTDVWTQAIYVFEKPTHSFYIVDDILMIMDTGGIYWLAYNDDRAHDLIDPKIATRFIY